MEALLHQVLSGLATGGIYASLALALVMIYQSTHHINFAQGEMAMFSTYLAWALINGGVPYGWAFALTITISFLSGIVIERVVIRPVEDAPVLSVITVFVALKWGFQAAMLIGCVAYVLAGLASRTALAADTTQFPRASVL